jgi:Zn-dependent protease with chaperone function
MSIGVAVAVTVAALVTGAGEPSAAERRVDGFEENVLSELAAVAPGAVAEARTASEAYRSRRWQEAFDGYDRVLVAAPGFSHALRRQCRARAELGDRAGALPLCRAALAAAPRSSNQLALAAVLAARDGERDPPAAERSEAVTLARAGLASDAGDVSTASGACDVALRTNTAPLLQDCAARLAALAPGELPTEFYGYFDALTRGEWRAARAHLAAARAAGLEPEPARRLGDLLDANEPAWSRWGPLAAGALAAWAAVLALLFVSGAMLSAITLRRARRMATDRRGGGSGAAALRKVYAAILWLTCGVYYLSLPLVALLVVAGGYAVWLGFAAIGRIPIKLVALVAIVVVVSLWAVLKSLWASLVRGKADDPGLRVDPSEHPRFQAALEESARRVGTRRVDTVFVTPGTDAAVYEQGGLARQLSGRTERCLVLGVGLLDGMTERQLKSVLAHEYGHFVNRNTAGGGFSLAVRRSVLHMAQALASGGAAAWYNPAWLFVTRFYQLFLRVSQGASRLQEILADRWAALAYGGETFAAGLSHVVTRSIRFDKHADATLREVIDGSLPLANLYRFAPTKPVEAQEVEGAIAQAMNAEPSAYDSHPRPADRIAWVGDVACAHGDAVDDASPAWSLFADREALERRLTDEVRANVRARHGVDIPAEAPAAGETPAA